MTRLNWYQVEEMEIIMFLNLLVFRHDTIEKEKKDREQWRRTH